MLNTHDGALLVIIAACHYTGCPSKGCSALKALLVFYV
jgi:hypothetical protein